MRPHALIPTVGVALLAALGPLSGAASAPPDGTGSTPVDTSADPPVHAAVDVDAAREGLAAWLAANRPATPQTSTDIPGCPALEEEAIEAAMGAAGVPGDLGDWETEIEWNEYADIDPDLMGIVCGGDTDGNANDSEFELAAGLVAVDAGITDRAVDVLTGFGFGALDVIDAEIPGVSGGTITTGCVEDGGLSACVTFWEHDGLIVGATLWSDRRALPDAASEAMLTELLPSILATLATHADAVPATPADTEPPVGGDGTPVGDARAGLDRILRNADTPLDAPLEPCVLADVATVDAAMATAGADAPLGGWGQWIGPLTPEDEWPQRGVVCDGTYVGTGDQSFPELRFALAAADFGDDETLGGYLAGYLEVTPDEDPIAAPSAGGETIGRCVERDRVHDCYEVWTDGSGFAVMVHVQDQTFFDRQAASVVVDALVPGVLDALGAGATQTGDELAGTDPGLVAAATAALTELASASDTDAVDCPAPDGAVDAALAGAGIDHPRDGWAAELGELDGEEGPQAPLRLRCHDRGDGTDPFVTLDVIAFADDGAAAEFVASVGLAEGGSPGDVGAGIVVVGSCTTVAGHEYCNAWWHDGPLAVGVTLFADADEITRNDAGEVLTALVPDVLTSLADLAAPTAPTAPTG